MREGDNSLRLPARLDTLGAIALAAPLRAMVTSGGAAAIDAGAVEHVGLAGLQLLLAARALASRAGQPFGVEGAGDAMEPALRMVGLLPPPADEAPGTPPVWHLSFTDRALMFGQEPLDHLEALHSLGVTIVAVLPAEGVARIFDEPDRIWLRFELSLPGGMSPDDIEPHLDAIGADCVVRRCDGAPAEPDWPPVREEPPQERTQEMRVPVLQERLDAMFSLIGDLVTSHASLVDRLGDQRVRLANQLADLDRAVAAMQDGILDISKAPIGDLLARIPGADRLRLSDGGEELERGIADRLAPALAALIDALPGPVAIPVDVQREGGLLALRLALPSGLAEAGRLCDAVRDIGGHGSSAGDGTLTLKLPRSLMLVEVMVVDVGTTTFAVPVVNLIEVLRPASGGVFDVHGPQRLLRFHGQYVPILPLGERFGSEGWIRDPRGAILLVVRAGERTVALQADMVSEQRQVMLRPIAGGIAPPRGISGAAILGANRLALVVNLAELG